MIIPYASRTGTRRNLDALRVAGWRLLVSATGVLRHEGFQYALDNGAWTAFQSGRPFDEKLFVKALRQLGRDADWTTIPDIVAGGNASLEYSLRWMRHVLDECERGLLAVQDGMRVEDVRPLVGMRVEDVRPLVGLRVGIFVGGSTKWKLSTISQWARLARETSSWCHVGRVNTARRIAQCAGAGVSSFDGTSASRFAKTLPLLDGARRQLALGLEN